VASGKKVPRTLAIVADYKRVFETAAGRRVLRRMMKESGMKEPSYVRGDPHGTSFNEGRRSVVIDILNKLKMDLESLEKQLLQNEEDDYSPFTEEA